MSREEFERVCAQHANALFCFVLSRLTGRDANKADDVCQESWLRAWRSQEQFDGRNFKGWLFRIASNVLTDEARKRQTIALSEESNLVDKQEQSGLEGMLDQERKAVVQECMKQLSPQEAVVVRLTAEGFSSQEIAEQLGVPVTKVYELRCSGFKKLRACAERKLP